MADEERYVVRDKSGMYYAPRYGKGAGAYREVTSAIPDVREVVSRRVAYAVVGHIDEPSRATVLKVRPKPKAPREVFFILRHDGGIVADHNGLGWESRAEAQGCTEPGDRVVRYVLAEGE